MCINGFFIIVRFEGDKTSEAVRLRLGSSSFFLISCCLSQSLLEKKTFEFRINETFIKAL